MRAMRTQVLVVVLAGCGFQPRGLDRTIDAGPDGPPPITCGDLMCDPHAICTASPAPSCACGSGYTGDGMTCAPIDPCTIDHGGCPAQVACIDMAGSATCFTPATCIAAGAGSDTSVTLYVGGDASEPWTAFCHAGLEYLTVANPSYGQYTQSNKSPGTNVRTTYTKLRVDPATLQIDICDQTFATSVGSLRHDPNNNPNLGPVTSMPLGVAMDCGGNKSATGVGSVDVSGTPFAIASTWTRGGNKTGGTTTASAQDRALAITGGGDCGWNAPAGAPGNPFNTFTPSKLITLQYAP
jgi:hypothetical protein